QSHFGTLYFPVGGYTDFLSAVRCNTVGAFYLQFGWRKGSRMKALLASIGLTAILLTPGAIGQTIDGNVVGTVLDPSGASIPGASVELMTVATGVKSLAKTTTAGDYRFSNVPVGSYTITVAASNFTSASLKDVAVDLNNTTTANVTLQVGAVANEVDVTDA